MSREDQENETRAILHQRAGLFLRAGGVVGWLEWQDLQAYEQAALVSAGKAIEVERAQRIATAILSGPAAISSEAEHDDALIQQTLTILNPGG